MKYDEITGLEYDETKLSQESWDYMLIDKLGIVQGRMIAHAIARTLKEAKERQMELGLRARTVIYNSKTDRIL